MVTQGIEQKKDKKKKYKTNKKQVQEQKYSKEKITNYIYQKFSKQCKNNELSEAIW